jgi:hypothetical protein
MSLTKKTQTMSNLDILKAHYAASARKDIDGMVAAFHPNIAWTEMAGFPLAGTYYGPEAVKQNVFFALGADWNNYDATPDAFVDGNEVIAVTGTYTAEHKASGKHLSVRFVHVWGFNDQGQITRFEQFTDTYLFRQTMNQ